ncbi:MAG: hypothetical protein IT441_02315 [Phycisphaeraceae bacterium]|nr:hypothetical protein [Phycisphaeraceae bacterium]
MSHRVSQIPSRWWTAAWTLAVLAMITGCPVKTNPSGAPLDRGAKVLVRAQHPDLANHSVAVLVAADDAVMLYNPQAVGNLTRAVAGELRLRLTGVSVVDPNQTATFTQENPTWSIWPYRRLLDRLGVECLLIVDLNHYQLHDPGNDHLWRGLADATVTVVGGEPAAKPRADASPSDAGASGRDNPSFTAQVRAEFPRNSAFGVLDADPKTIELGLNRVLAAQVVYLFYDHEEIR